MCFIIKLGMNSLHIMIVDEIVKLQSLSTISAHLIKASHRMGNFEIIVIIMSGIKCLMKLIIRHRMKCSFVHPTGIISMDYFTHQPEIRFYFISNMTQSFHIIKIQNVCCIQANTVNIKLFYPKANHITDIITNCRIFLIQLHQQIISSPVFVGKSIVVFIISPEIHIAEPIFIRRIFTVAFQILKCKEVTPCMIKYTIQNHPNSLSMTFSHKICQILICSQTTVQFPVICSLIAMSNRLKKRSYIKSIAANLLNMKNPRNHRIQTRLLLLI